MSDTTASLTRKINSAEDLQSVVRTMKALAGSSIGQYEQSVRALADYYRTVELGLGACFRKNEPAALVVERKEPTAVDAIGAVVFGSDQGLVGHHASPQRVGHLCGKLQRRRKRATILSGIRQPSPHRRSSSNSASPGRCGGTARA